MLVQAQRSDGPREGGHRTEFEHQQYPGRLLHGEYRERSATIEFEFFGGEPQVLVLTQFSASSTNDPYDEGHAKAWAELPEKRVDENFVYVSHFASLNNRTVRNYSFCYDKTLHVAHWVAYPLHSVYRGSIDRTDDFQYDPKVDYSWQPNLAAGSYRGSYISSLRRTVRLRGS